MTDLRDALPKRRRTRTYDATNFEALAAYLEEYLTPIGSIVAKFTTVAPGPAWLRMQGQWVSKADYPALYAEIGGMFGERTLEFMLPDLDGSYLVGAGEVQAGVAVGANQLTLTVEQMPEHSHGVTDPGHTHTFTGTPHSHGITDPGHSHIAAEPAGAADAASGTDVTSATAGTTSTEATGITVDDATADGTNETSEAGVSVDNAGGGQPVDIRPKSIAVHYFIKARV